MVGLFNGGSAVIACPAWLFGVEPMPVPAPAAWNLKMDVLFRLELVSAHDRYVSHP
jgi:hypothetical protein